MDPSLVEVLSRLNHQIGFTEGAIKHEQQLAGEMRRLPSEVVLVFWNQVIIMRALATLLQRIG